MKSSETWTPTKYELHDKILRATHNTTHLLVSSRLVADAVGKIYSEWIPRYCRGTLADVGCGNLPMYGLYRDFAAEVVAIDWENSLHKNPHLDISADLNCVPIPGVESESVDTILCSDVLEHLYEPKNFLREMNRILKSDGILLLNVPFHYWVHEAPYDYFRYTPFALHRMLEDAGFEMVEERSCGAALDVVADILAKISFCRYPQCGTFMAKLFQKIPAFFGKLPFLQKLTWVSPDFALGFAVAARKKREES